MDHSSSQTGARSSLIADDDSAALALEGVAGSQKFAAESLEEGREAGDKQSQRAQPAGRARLMGAEFQAAENNYDGPAAEAQTRSVDMIISKVDQRERRLEELQLEQKQQASARRRCADGELRARTPQQEASREFASQRLHNVASSELGGGGGEFASGAGCASARPDQVADHQEQHRKRSRRRRNKQRAQLAPQVDAQQGRNQQHRSIMLKTLIRGTGGASNKVGYVPAPSESGPRASGGSSSSASGSRCSSSASESAPRAAIECAQLRYQVTEVDLNDLLNVRQKEILHGIDLNVPE